MQFDCVVFDLDGTVVDSHRYTFDAFRHAVAPWCQAPSDEQIHAAFGPAENIILEQFVSAVHVDEAYTRLQEWYGQHVDEVWPHPGIRELLQELGERRVSRGLFTGRALDSTNLLLGHHKLSGLFDAVVAGDSPCAPKPSGEGILHLMEQLQCRASRTLVVGDSILDLQAAAAAGVQGVGVSWFTSTAISGIQSATLRDPEDLRHRVGLER
jgi:pyrophosphatase PpaX